MANFSEWRRDEISNLIKLNGDLGSVNSININILSAGKQHNVIPEVAEATIDIRIRPDNTLKDIEHKFDEFMGTSGVTWNYLLKPEICPASSTDSDNFYWSSLQDTLKEWYI